MHLKRNLRCQSKRGFTLIELIVTIFIASILICVFSLLLDFSFKTLEYSFIANDNVDSGIHLLGLINDEVVKSEVIYKSDDFLLNESYKNNLGFVIRLKNDTNYTYIYYAFKDSNIWRIAINTSQSDPNKVSFKNLGDTGENSIIDNVSSIEGTSFNKGSKLISLSIEVNNSKKEKYCTQLYVNRVGEL